MEHQLKTKYLHLLKVKGANPVPSTKPKKGAEISMGFSDLTESHLPTDTKPILFSVKHFSMLYKKAKLSKAKSGWFVWFEYKNPETGVFEKHIRKCGINRIKSLNERKREAAALIDAVNELLASEWSPYGTANKSASEDISNKTLYQCMDYVLTLKESLAPASYNHYKSTVKVFKDFLELNQMKFIFPQMFRNVDAINFGDYMLLTKGYKGVTYNGHRENLNGFFNEIYKRLEIHKESPFKAIRKQREIDAIHKPFTHDQRAALKAYFINHKPRLGMYCQLIYYCGLRPIEILRIKVGDIKLNQKAIVIYGAAAKNNKQQSVVLPQPLVEMLSKMNLEQYPAHYYLFGHHLNTCETNWRRKYVSEMHRNVLNKLKIDKEHTLYSWKHTGAVESYMIHKDPYKIMKQLRHHSLEMTMKYLRSLGLDANFTYDVPVF